MFEVLRLRIEVPLVVLLGLVACGGCGKKPNDVHPPTTTEKKAPVERSVETVVVSLEQQRAAKFEFSRVEIRPSARVVQTTGTIMPNETRVSRIRALSAGKVLRVSVRSGDPVRKGQELLTYDNIELGETVGEYFRSIAGLEQAKTASEVARRSRDRARDLVEVGAVARAELDRREAEFKNSEAQIRAQNAEVARVDEKLHRYGLTEVEIQSLLERKPSDFHREYSLTTLRSPFDGVVLAAKAAEGDTIQTNDQLFEVVDLSTVWVQADVYPQDLAAIREGGDAVVFVETYSKEKFQGRITLVSDAVNPETRTTRVRIEVPNPGRRLKLEMFATIQLPTKDERPVLTVPSVAIQELDGGSVVFVRESETSFAIRPVKAGPDLRGGVEILSGLKAGEVVVARGSFTLKSEHEKSEMSEGGHH